MSKKMPTLQPWQVEDAKRLDALYKKKKEKIPQDQFGPKYGLGTQGYVSQLLTARRPLNVESAEKFAGALNVQIEEFSPTLAGLIKKAATKVSAKDSKFSPETLRFAEKFEKLGPEGRKKFEQIYTLVLEEEKESIDGDDLLIPRPHPMRRKEDRKPPSTGKQSNKNGSI